MRAMRFSDRRAAGRVLAAQLLEYAGGSDVVVLGLPRGGVMVAVEVAKALHAPLDVWLVRKLGVPGHEELAMGAVASDGAVVLNEEIVRSLEITPAAIERVTLDEWRELERRERAYRGGRQPVDVAGKTVILVDDGLATGASMSVAVEAMRAKGPAWLVAAVPVAGPDTCRELARQVDQMICAETPELFIGVGDWYEDFSQVTDDEVRAALREVSAGQGEGAPAVPGEDHVT